MAAWRYKSSLCRVDKIFHLFAAFIREIFFNARRELSYLRAAVLYSLFILLLLLFYYHDCYNCIFIYLFNKWQCVERKPHRKRVLDGNEPTTLCAPVGCWFSNRTGTSVDVGARKSNNWLDEWQSGKLGTKSRVWSFPRAFPSSNDVPVLLLNQRSGQVSANVYLPSECEVKRHICWFHLQVI